MIRLVFAVLCLYPIDQNLSAQSPEPRQPACKIKELIDRRGWKIPGLAKATVLIHAHYKSEGIPDNVFIDIMESQAPEASFTYVGLQSCDTAVLNIRSVDVTKIERFTMNGHAFGYRVTGTISGFDNQGHRIHAGSDEHVYSTIPTARANFPS